MSPASTTIVSRPVWTGRQLPSRLPELLEIGRARVPGVLGAEPGVAALTVAAGQVIAVLDRLGQAEEVARGPVGGLGQLGLDAVAGDREEADVGERLADRAGEPGAGGAAGAPVAEVHDRDVLVHRLGAAYPILCSISGRLAKNRLRRGSL
jgi:hypothetical protein